MSQDRKGKHIASVEDPLTDVYGNKQDQKMYRIC